MRLRHLLEWLSLQQPWTPQQVKLMRWFHVREGLDRRGKGWDGSAYEYAADVLTGTPAAAGPDMMKKSYAEMQKKLPPAQRRPRTYRPWQRH